jgi:hypothetical protein
MTRVSTRSSIASARRAASVKRERSEEASKENEPINVSAAAMVAKKRRSVVNGAEESVKRAIDDLLFHLSGDNASLWKTALQPLFSTPSFASLARFVAAERVQHVVYPPPEATWTALNECPLDAVKVVVVGQDPYHGPDQAHGLCFSVRPGQAVPPSLKNMYVYVIFHTTTLSNDKGYTAVNAFVMW